MRLRDLMLLAAVVTGFSFPCAGQSVFDQLNFLTSRGGFQFYGVSAFMGYSSSAYPLAAVSQTNNQVDISSIRSTTNYGGSTGIGWHHNRERTNFSAGYRLSFNGNTRYSSVNGLNHVLSLNGAHRIGTKFTVSFSGSGSLTSLVHVLQQPSSLGLISQLPLTINDLAASASIGQYSSVQASSLVGAASVIGNSPVRTVLLGDRVLTYSANVSGSYSISERLQLYFGSFTAAGQNRSTSGQNYIMPRSIGVNGGLGFSYSVSPRTSVGAGLSVTRSANIYQTSISTSLTANVGRRMGLHWFLSGNGGYSYTIFTQQLYSSATTRLMIGGGSIGYKFRAQTVMATYNRSASDVYGYSTGVSSNAISGWNWRRPGTWWGVTASGGQQHSGQNGYSNIDGWHGTAGFNFILSNQAVVSLSYGYSQSEGTFLRAFSGSNTLTTQTNRIKVQSVRLTIGWSPQGRMMSGGNMPGGGMPGQMGSRGTGGFDR
jgi:hypothetical protein